MERIIYEKPQRIIRNRRKLEEMLGIKITGKDNKIVIQGTPEDEYVAEKVIDALEFGFPFSVALLIKEEDLMFEIMNIKEYTRRKDLEKVRARIIGKRGKTLRTLLELTKCHFEIKGNQVGIIGEPEYMRNAQDAMISLIRGAKHANVYAFLEKHQVKPVLDLGLKPLKKEKGQKGKKKNR
jgi:ribosomal RNA assembly protein